jgi:hypothetical protein
LGFRGAEDKKGKKSKTGIGLGLLSLLVVAIVLAIAVGALQCRFGFRNSVGIILDLVTILGIAIGGVWAYYLFVIRRFSQPKMDVDQKVHYWDSGDDYFFVRVEMIIKNVGEVLFPINQVMIYLYGMRPWPDNLKRLLEKAASSTEYRPCEIPIEKMYAKTVSFPEGDYLVEPGEREPLTFDFPVSKKTEMIAVYTFLYNIEGEIGWSNTSYVSFSTDVQEQGGSQHGKAG